VDHPRARATRYCAGILEEREVGAGAGVLVTVEEVVDEGVVLVDRLGGQSQAEDARVEVDVPAGVARDRADVVEAVEVHNEESYQVVARTTTSAFG